MSAQSLIVANNMAQPPPTEAVPDIEKPLPYWRWIDDEYIAQGKVSKTAIVEIFLAMGFYYLVARYSPYPLVTVFTFLAVPLLLLRSDASIERGVDLLKESWGGRVLVGHKEWLIGLVSFAISAALSYWFADDMVQNWVSGQSGWMLIWCLVIFVAISSTLVIQLITVAFGTIVGLGAKGGALVLAGWMTGIGFLAGAMTFNGNSALTSFVTGVVGFVVVTASCVGPSPVSVIFLPGLVLGQFLQGVIFRIRATVPHLPEGVTAFTHNLYQVVVVSDFRHAPALIPKAGQVDNIFNVASMPKGDGSIFIGFFRFVLQVIMFVGATLYRWNIKASCWIWWPLALLLAEVRWPRDPALAADKAPDVRRTTTQFWSSEYFIGGLIACISVVFVYLLYPDISGDWTNKIPDWLRNLIFLIPTNTQNIRYWLIALFFVALLTMFICMLKARTHAETLQNHEVHQNLPKNPDPSIDRNFGNAAKWLVKARMFIFGSFLLLVYALGLRYAIDKWPDHVGGVVFSWLKNML